MKRLVTTLVSCSALIIAGTAFSADTIKIGYNIPMTGDIPEIGESSKYRENNL